MIKPYEVPYPFVVRRSGKVQSVRRLRPQSFNYNMSKDGFTVIPIEDEDGCLLVNLYQSKAHRQYVHRLVAEKFIPNPEGYEYVMFKDGNVKNCSADNLEWCP